jgi:hypothetical protein
MLQFQYYNTKLTKKQIDSILNNFNIKYTTVKNEIDSKINNLLKLFMDDILSFLENIEEISKEVKKIKEFDKIQRDYEVVSSKLKEKTLNEHKLENDIISLQKEIEDLKKCENKNKEIKENKKQELKTPSTTKNKQIKSIFTNNKHSKIKSEYINKTYSNEITSNSKNETNSMNSTKYNTIRNTYKTKQKNNIQNKDKNNIRSSSVNRRKKDNNKNKDKYTKDKKSCSPDITESNKKNTSNIDKTIEKIKQYSMNRNNERIKKMQKSSSLKKRLRFKRNNKIINDLYGYKKNALTLKKEKNKLKDKDKEKEKVDEDDDLEENKTFEYAEKFLRLVESIPDKDTIKQNNYSEDDDHNGNNKIDKIDRIDNNMSRSISEDINSEEIESLDNEIKELEEDENNILMLMKQIKDLSSNSIVNLNK